MNECEVEGDDENDSSEDVAGTIDEYEIDSEAENVQ